jgi:hypothetical protein
MLAVRIALFGAVRNADAVVHSLVKTCAREKK